MRSGSTALATGRVEPRLAVILAADVADYSLGEDEEGTLSRPKALRRELADPAPTLSTVCSTNTLDSAGNPIPHELRSQGNRDDGHSPCDQPFFRAFGFRGWSSGRIDRSRRRFADDALARVDFQRPGHNCSRHRPSLCRNHQDVWHCRPPSPEDHRLAGDPAPCLRQYSGGDLYLGHTLRVRGPGRCVATADHNRACLRTNSDRGLRRLASVVATGDCNAPLGT